MPLSTNDYAARAQQLRRRARGLSLGCMTPLLLLSLPVTVWYAMTVAESGWRLVDGALLCVSAIVSLTLVFMLMRSLGESSLLRIVPYFEASLEHPDAFTNTGFALARQHAALEALCEARGLTPLSSFGFADDWYDEALVWHDPARGLRVTRALLEALGREPGLMDEQAAVIDDLSRLQGALQRALEREVRFCLHIRWRDDLISPVEMDQRVGAYM